MKSDLQKLRKIKNAIIGIKMQLNLIEGDLLTIDNNLDHLHKIEEDLMFNINLLKNEKIIAIASQYKQSKIELKVIRKNISNYEKMKKSLANKMIFFLKSHQSNMEEYKELKKTVDNRKVILLFDPKRKKKKQ